jgi:hypothetical protein
MLHAEALVVCPNNRTKHRDQTVPENQALTVASQVAVRVLTTGLPATSLLCNTLIRGGPCSMEGACGVHFGASYMYCSECNMWVVFIAVNTTVRY